MFSLGTLVRVGLCGEVRWDDLGEGQGPWGGSREAMVSRAKERWRKSGVSWGPEPVEILF